jgi:hypothetical protein
LKLAEVALGTISDLQAAAETLQKPEASFMINVIYNELLAPGGTFDPAFNLRIVSSANPDLFVCVG